MTFVISVPKLPASPDLIEPEEPVRPTIGLDPSQGESESLGSAKVEKKCLDTSLWTIVGGILGGIVLLLLILLLLFCLYRRGCFDTLHAPFSKGIPSAPAAENPYDGLDESKRTGDVFANRMYGGYMIGGGKATEAGLHGNKGKDTPYDDVKGQDQGNYDNVKGQEGQYDNPGFGGDKSVNLPSENPYDNV